MQKTVVPQVQSIEGRRHSFRAAEADPQQITEIPQLLFVFRWSMSLLCGSCRFSGAAVEKTFVLPLRKTSRSQCLPFFCRQAQMLGIMASMAQKDSYAATQRPRSSPTSAVACALLVLLFALCSLLVERSLPFSCGLA